MSRPTGPAPFAGTDGLFQPPHAFCCLRLQTTKRSQLLIHSMKLPPAVARHRRVLLERMHVDVVLRQRSL